MDGDALKAHNMNRGAPKKNVMDWPKTKSERISPQELFGRQFPVDYSDLSLYEKYEAPDHPFEGGTNDDGLKYGQQYRHEFNRGNDGYELFRYDGGDYEKPTYFLWKNGRDTGLKTQRPESIDEYIDIYNRPRGTGEEEDAWLNALDAWDKKYGG